MPRAKFGPNPLKTLAVHNEQRNRQTDRLSYNLSTQSVTVKWKSRISVIVAIGCQHMLTERRQSPEWEANLCRELGFVYAS